jgi:thioredoxin 1
MPACISGQYCLTNAELEKAYKGRAAVVFIDIWKQPEYAKKFGVRAIPTQIFFDKDGKEVFRHMGFMDKKSIIEKMKELGISEPV